MLREQLATVVTNSVYFQSNQAKYIAELIERAEAAEAKLKELSEQEPIAFEVIEGSAAKGILTRTKPTDEECSEYELSVQNLYAHPVPPVDVQELQSDQGVFNPEYVKQLQLDALSANARIAELERKLAEQQAVIYWFNYLVSESSGVAGWHLNGTVADWGEFGIPDSGAEELNTLRAKARDEGRKEAVLEGVLADVAAERSRQHAKWDGVFDDQAYTPLDWHEMIADYNGWARRMACMRSFDKARTRYVQIAALAVAAVEAQDAMISAAPTPGEKE